MNGTRHTAADAAVVIHTKSARGARSGMKRTRRKNNDKETDTLQSFMPLG